MPVILSRLDKKDYDQFGRVKTIGYPDAGAEEASGDRFRHYLLDTGYMLKRRALDARVARDLFSKPRRYDFHAGRLLAYYEVVGVLLSQAEAFGIPAEDLGLDEIDSDRDLT